MGSTTANPATPETFWASVPQAADLIPMKPTSVYRTVREQKRGIAKRNPFVFRETNGIIEIDTRYLPPDAKRRQLKKGLTAAGEALLMQGRLFAETDVDREVRLLSTSPPKQGVEEALWKFKLLDQLNHSSTAEIARQAGRTERTLRRWTTTFRETNEIGALANKRPGPPAGTGTVVDALMQAHIDDCVVNKKLNFAQTYRSLTDRLMARGVHKFPHRVTVERYIKKHLQGNANPLRGGPDLLHTFVGYIDRKFTDLASLERVETDEFKTDLLAYDDARPKIVRRFWLLTFYDCRSIYPLVWELVAGSEYELRHGIAEEDEIDLLTRLVHEYGVPAAIHSDRGRFRGKTFGGKPLGDVIDAKFAQANGILDQLGIRHNMPRVHNPRGTRLERFHRFLADSSRQVPGWIGADTKQRKMAPGDEQQIQHEEWVRGKRQATPLLSRSQLLAHINAWMEAWRDHESNGTDMRGLSPRAVFTHCTPAGGFKRISEEALALATAQHFENETVESGGIITLPDGSRYSHPLLVLIQAEQREVVRLRHDHSFISVLPAQKGEEAIIAPRRVRVGTNDPDELARQSEMHARLEKLVKGFGQRNPGSEPRRFKPIPITKELADDGPQIAAEIIAPPEEESAPSLYQIGPITAEEA